MAAVSAAAGAPVTPFFRFTGLADSANLISYLASRQMASFSVDAVSNDSYIHDAKALIERTMAEVTRRCAFASASVTGIAAGAEIWA